MPHLRFLTLFLTIHYSFGPENKPKQNKGIKEIIFLKHVATTVFTTEVRVCCLAEPSCYLLHSQVNSVLKCTYARVHGNLRASTC